jgi:hypothetical protein
VSPPRLSLSLCLSVCLTTPLLPPSRDLIERFVEARKNSKRNPTEMVSICEELLQEPQLDLAIRVGDCLAMLVEYFHSTGNMKKSYQYMCSMKERRILLHPYIDAEVLDDVSRAVGQRLDDHEDAEDVDEGDGDGDQEEAQSPQRAGGGRGGGATEKKNEYYGKKPQAQQDDDDDIVDEEELGEVTPASHYSPPPPPLPWR